MKNLPIDAIPTDIRTTNQSYMIDIRMPPIFCCTINIVPEIPQWQSVILKNTEVYDQALFQKVVEDNADITMVSEGGMYNYQGNFGLVVAHKNTSLVGNYGKRYSIEFYKSSYRSELCRVLSGLVTFHYLISTLKLKLHAKKQLLLHCDKNSVVKKLTSRQELRRMVNQHRHPDVDIEMQVLHKISLLEAKGCHVTIQHVYGHQDTQKLLTN
jgi:hypothetical protein